MHRLIGAGGALAATLAFAASAAASDTVVVDRADYFTDASGAFVSIEARGDDASSALTAHVPGAADTALQPFLVRGSYVEHRALVPVSSRPADVRVTSAGGGSGTLDVRDWSAGAGTVVPPGYLQDFQSNYVDPQKASARITNLAAEFPSLAQVYNLPFSTAGYQRHAQAIVGTATPYTGARGRLTGPASVQAVVVTSKAWGQDGGNDVTISLVDPHAASMPLSVTVSGDDVTVHLATDAAGAITSTAVQVTSALNASPSASALLTASLYRNNAGAGVVAPTSMTHLSDYLNAPPSYTRGPQQVRMLRIGAHRDGSRPGVLLFSQVRGDEEVTPLVTLEEAERLLRNYATDARTKELLDNLDIFVVPSVNPDGAAYAFYDSAGPDGKNMASYCTAIDATDPLARDLWGVDIAHNFSVGSLFDGFVGASSACASDAFTGPSELSEPESRDLQWVGTTFPNIGFAMDVTGSGSWLTWPPGAFNGAREPLPRPSRAQDEWFDATARSIVEHMKADRGTVIPPQNAGAPVDVRDSEAGNPLDELFYNRGILGFELGVGEDPQPAFAEGRDEALEGADGVTGLLDAALAYGRDTQPPQVGVTPAPAGPARSARVSFTASEPATIHYTLDGSTPDGTSPVWAPSDPRGRPQALAIDHTTTVKWFATDVKGNQSAVASARYVIDTAAPATTASVAPAAASGWWRSPVVSLVATDTGEAGVAATEYEIDGGPWQTYDGPVAVTGDGLRTFAYRSRDAAGNVEAPQSLTVRLDGTAPAVSLRVPAHAELARGERRTVAFHCSDAGSGIAGCTGARRLDTRRAGRHALVVTATDVAGNTTTRRWTYTVLGRAPKLRVRAPRLTARGLRLALTDRLRSAVKVTGALRTRRGGPSVRVRTTRVHLEAGRTRTVTVRLAHPVHGAHALVATLRLATTSGKLHRTTTQRLRVVSR